MVKARVQRKRVKMMSSPLVGQGSLNVTLEVALVVAFLTRCCLPRGVATTHM